MRHLPLGVVLRPLARRAASAGLVVTICAALVAPAIAASPPSLTLYAGNGTYGPVVPGPAPSSPLGDARGLGVDASGNVFTSEGNNNHIARIAPDGTLSVFAGDGTSGSALPGAALASPLNVMYAMTMDSAGNVYAADYVDDRIVKITPGGTLSIFAGSGTLGHPVAGPALASPLNSMWSMAADAHGNVYLQDIADNTIWKISASGSLSKVAGNGSDGPAVAGPALASPLGLMYGSFAVTPDGTIYLPDYAYGYVYRITPGGTLSVIAGDGSFGIPVQGPAATSPIGLPGGVAVDPAGNLYVGDLANNLIERITPGGTLSVYAGDGTYGTPVAGVPTASPTPLPLWLTTDSAGTLYVTTGYDRVLRIGSAVPSAPRNLTAAPGTGSAVLAFDPPVTPGTSAITGYEVSTDAGATWHAVTTAPGSGSALTATAGGLGGGAHTVLVRAVNANGAGDGAAIEATLPATVVPVATPVIVPGSPAIAARPFAVAVSLRLPDGCARACVITKATLALRGGTTILGTRRNVKITKGGKVRFTITIDKAKLLAAAGQVLKPGWRTTLTRFTVSARMANGDRWSHVRDGRIAVALARLTSGLPPSFSGML